MQSHVRVAAAYWVAAALVFDVCGMLAAAAAQTEFSGLPENGAPIFWADAAAFRGTSADSCRIEVYYKVHNPNLTYVRRESTYVASYEITGILRGRNNPQVASCSVAETYSLPTYKDTQDGESYLVNKMELFAPPGEYKLELTLQDRISRRSFARPLEVHVPAFANAVYAMSSPLFCRPASSGVVPDKFVKYGHAIVPEVARSYGGKQEDVPIYLEVYSPVGDTTRELFVLSRTFNRFQKLTRLDTVRFFPEAGGKTPVIVTVSLKDFVPGEVELAVQLTDGVQPLADEVKTGFKVEWSLLSLVRFDWKAAIDQLVHIAEPRELKALREAPPDKHVEMFDAFWKAKDPTPDTPENEWENEYYRRIRFADQHFTNPYRRGWRTDFGMIYIKYGEPDQIERYPFEMGQKPFEIWYYYGQGRKFVFVDAKGNDDYQLQYPFDGLYH